MNDCPTCGFPMAWSETHEREWCSVYGDHKTSPQTVSSRSRWVKRYDENGEHVVYRQNINAPGYALVSTLAADLYTQKSTGRPQDNPHGCTPSGPQPSTRTMAA